MQRQTKRKRKKKMQCVPYSLFFIYETNLCITFKQKHSQAIREKIRKYMQM